MHLCCCCLKVTDFCSLKEVCQTVQIAPHNVVIIKQCFVNCPLSETWDMKTRETKQNKWKERRIGY
jgi:hypothetical protein